MSELWPQPLESESVLHLEEVLVVWTAGPPWEPPCVCSAHDWREMPLLNWKIHTQWKWKYKARPPLNVTQRLHSSDFVLSPYLSLHCECLSGGPRNYPLPSGLLHLWFLVTQRSRSPSFSSTAEAGAQNTHIISSLSCGPCLPTPSYLAQRLEFRFPSCYEWDAR